MTNKNKMVIKAKTTSKSIDKGGGGQGLLVVVERLDVSVVCGLSFTIE